MVTPMLAELADLWHWLTSPATFLFAIFQIWMLIDAIRREEWMWVLFLIFLPGFSAFCYFFFVYRSAPSVTRGFELPGAQSRKRIQELQSQIHHLDKAHHHSQLGDIYFQRGKLDKAEACYRASLERDPQDIDTRAHFGQCLLRQKKPQDALPLLQGVIAENPKHDYGYSLMALAETLNAVGQPEDAIKAWQQVTETHSYPRARVQLAELYLANGKSDSAKAQLQEVISDDPHTPGFQRKRDRVWVRRAKKLVRRIR
jgi:hypothetical protein